MTERESANADKLNLADKLALFTEHWSPTTIADAMNTGDSGGELTAETRRV